MRDLRSSSEKYFPRLLKQKPINKRVCGCFMNETVIFLFNAPEPNNIMVSLFKGLGEFISYPSHM